MALLWERYAGATHYQVRSAGRSLRLYTNGVFHSQYNPARPVTGSVWDLLFLPALFYSPHELRRVLVLGVGGGAVIRQLTRFVEPDSVVGVDRNRVHLAVARRFFGVTAENTRLEHADAVHWLRDYRGPAFDMIIDDLFGEYDGEPQRAVQAGSEWVAALLRHLSPGGLIVSNFSCLPELETAAYRVDTACRGRFSAAFHLSTARNYNAVGAFLTRAAGTTQLRERVKGIAALDPRRKRGLRYRIRTLAR